MPRLMLDRVPKYRRHKSSGQSLVTVDHYLGPFGSKASKVKYDRLVTEWLAAGRRPLIGAIGGSITVVELAAAYWRHARSYYRKDGKPTRTQERIKFALRLLKVG